MNDYFDDDSAEKTMKDRYRAIQKADDATEREQAENILSTIYFKLIVEKRMLEKAKQSGDKDVDYAAKHFAQNKLDFVNALLSIEGLEELAHRLDEQKQQQEIIEITESSKVEQRLLFIKGAICALGYDPLAIPTGGKKNIEVACLKDAKLFTKPTFDSVWKEARKRDLVKMREHDTFMPG